jgi:transketolase
VLSKGHANAALAATLAQAGFIEPGELNSFNSLGALAAMHPEVKTPGIEANTGALGHGLPIGVGVALGAKLQQCDFRTVVMLGDGELQEGSVWEAAMLAGQRQLAQLTAVVDYNKVQQSSRVNEVLDLEPLAGKWQAFGWSVREVDGHDMEKLVDALDALPYAPDRPSVLIAHTVKGKGVSFSEDTYVWHNHPVTDEHLRQALGELGDSA